MPRIASPSPCLPIPGHLAPTTTRHTPHTHTRTTPHIPHLTTHAHSAFPSPCVRPSHLHHTHPPYISLLHLHSDALARSPFPPTVFHASYGHTHPLRPHQHHHRSHSPRAATHTHCPATINIHSQTCPLLQLAITASASSQPFPRSRSPPHPTASIHGVFRSGVLSSEVFRLALFARSFSFGSVSSEVFRLERFVRE